MTEVGQAPSALLTVQQVAAELHITTRAVRHRIQVGTLAATKLGAGTSAYVIQRSEVDRVLREASA